MVSVVGESKQFHASKPFLLEMGRKVIQEAFWNDEVHQELLAKGLHFHFRGDSNREACMEMIDDHRATSICV